MYSPGISTAGTRYVDIDRKGHTTRDDPPVAIPMLYCNVVMPDGRSAEMDDEISLHVTEPFNVTGGDDVRYWAGLGGRYSMSPSSVFASGAKDNGTGLPSSLVKAGSSMDAWSEGSG